ncbi:MAG: type II secretion system major pseudopilin GspG [Endozoicomonadaceae bacterium]|nr:type II secretion system major pseudopilin GspG [Endozoicomonadaceae bacterium]
MHNIRNVKYHSKKPKMSGFTLIEVMIVVVILAILASIVVPNFLSRPDQAKIAATKANINALGVAIDFYFIDNGKYPSNEQGLNALVYKTSIPPIPVNFPVQAYLKNPSALLDPWGREYQYENPGMHNVNSYDIYSLGPTGREGGSGKDAIIGNWDPE